MKLLKWLDNAIMFLVTVMVFLVVLLFCSLMFGLFLYIPIQVLRALGAL